MYDVGSSPGGSGLTIPWPWISVILGVVSIGALGALAVVGGTNDADALSTIALALAVLAFSAQLILALAQGMAGAQQVAQVERVNANTQSALSALRATSEALLTTQREQFGQVLSAALERAVPEAFNEAFPGTQSEVDESDSDSERQSEALQEAIISRVEELLSKDRPRRITATHFPENRTEPTHRFNQMDEWPNESRGRELAKLFKSLTPWEAQMFARIVEGSRNRARNGRPTGAWLKVTRKEGPGPGNMGLVDKGLIHLDHEKTARERPNEGVIWRDLTDLGVELASILRSGPTAPDWLYDEMSNS